MSKHPQAPQPINTEGMEVKEKIDWKSTSIDFPEVTPDTHITCLLLCIDENGSEFTVSNIIHEKHVKWLAHLDKKLLHQSDWSWMSNEKSIKFLEEISEIASNHMKSETIVPQTPATFVENTDNMVYELDKKLVIYRMFTRLSLKTLTLFATISPKANPHENLVFSSSTTAWDDKFTAQTMVKVLVNFMFHPELEIGKVREALGPKS